MPVWPISDISVKGTIMEISALLSMMGSPVCCIPQRFLSTVLLHLISFIWSVCAISKL